MRILIVGAGALGGYFGARLHASGRDVTFLVRPQRVQQLAAAGLHVQSPKGDVSVHQPAILTAQQLTQPFDLILLSCKAYDLTGAMDSFAAAVGPQTSILPLLNGMAHLQELDDRFGREKILGGLSRISAVRQSDGSIAHLGDWDSIYFGDRDQPGSDRAHRVAEALADAGFELRLSENIMQEMWDKWCTIATAAGITCVMRGSVGNIVAANGIPLVKQLLEECAAIASHEGYTPSQTTLSRISGLLTEAGSTFTASMLRDLESGAPVENDHILGDLLDHAKRARIATPLLNIAHVHVRCYEERFRRTSDVPS